MSDAPLMPKATAIWLLDNTSLTFDQIAGYCRLHPLEVKAIADGDSAQGIKGLDPIASGQLSRDELEAAQKDANYRMKVAESKVKLAPARRRGPRYTPVSKRQDRPNAIRWLIRNHPELKDAQIIRLVGTTKATIEAIREGSHWNAANLTPVDPVSLGLCTQISLDMEVQKANKGRDTQVEGTPGETLIPASQTQMATPSPENETGEKEGEKELDAQAVFAKFAKLKP
jgi:hypothetical protein